MRNWLTQAWGCQAAPGGLGPQSGDGCESLWGRESGRGVTSRLEPRKREREPQEDGRKPTHSTRVRADQQRCVAVAKSLTSLFCLPHLARISFVAHPKQKPPGKGIV